jgi:hypothetical protein
MGSLRSLQREKSEEGKKTPVVDKPSLPPPGRVRIYLRDDNFYIMTSEGTETLIPETDYAFWGSVNG